MASMAAESTEMVPPPDPISISLPFRRYAGREERGGRRLLTAYPDNQTLL
jgi:hypothetical protein